MEDEDPSAKLVAEKEKLVAKYESSESGASDYDKNSKKNQDESMQFKNPLKKRKRIDVDGDVSEGSWSDESDSNLKGKKKKESGKKSLLGKRKRGEEADKAGDGA